MPSALALFSLRESFLGMGKDAPRLGESTMPTKFKNLVRARVAKTGEGWQTAARQVAHKRHSPRSRS
jgi:hypothetical protein